MTTQKIALTLVIVALVGVLGAPAVLAQGTGIVEGQVLHAESGPLGGAFVQLDHFQGMTLVDSATAQTDTEGRFKFIDLAPGSDQVYIARVMYEDVEYSSGMVVLTDEEPTQSVTVTITGNTDDDSGIVLERVHLIVQPIAEAVQVGQMMIVSNYGDKAYVGSPLADGTIATVRVLLPADAADVAFDSGEVGGRFIEMDGGVADTQAVPPGRSVDQLVVSYNLPPQSKAWTLDLQFPYAVNALNVLVMRSGWGLSSDHLTYQGVMGSDTSSFFNYSGGGLDAGQTLSLRFAPGEPETTAATEADAPAATLEPATSSQETLLVIAIGLCAVLLLAVLSYPVWRREE